MPYNRKELVSMITDLANYLYIFLILIFYWAYDEEIITFSRCIGFDGLTSLIITIGLMILTTLLFLRKYNHLLSFFRIWLYAIAFALVDEEKKLLYGSIFVIILVIIFAMSRFGKKLHMVPWKN